MVCNHDKIFYLYEPSNIISEVRIEILSLTEIELLLYINYRDCLLPWIQEVISDNSMIIHMPTFYSKEELLTWLNKFPLNLKGTP